MTGAERAAVAEFRYQAGYGLVGAAAISGRPCVLGKPRPGVGGSPPPQGVYIRPAVPDVRLGRRRG